MFGAFPHSESRVFELADGRRLFYAAGRAYYLDGLADGQRLQRQLTWTPSLSTLATVRSIPTSTSPPWLG